MMQAPDSLPSPLWVFGYGSLMWNPGFPFAERQVARLDGYHRSFCMSSIHHRGTVEAPGLVLALDPSRGAACHGLAYRVPDEAAEATVSYLRERELISSAYVEEVVPITLVDGRRRAALTYVVDITHEQYVGGLPLEEQARIISGAVGGRGPNAEYLHNTVAHLAELGLADEDLNWLDRRVRAMDGGSG